MATSHSFSPPLLAKAAPFVVGALIGLGLNATEQYLDKGEVELDGGMAVDVGLGALTGGLAGSAIKAIRHGSRFTGVAKAYLYGGSALGVGGGDQLLSSDRGPFPALRKARDQQSTRSQLSA
jgi:hypothetical protein